MKFSQKSLSTVREEINDEVGVQEKFVPHVKAEYPVDVSCACE